MTYTKKQVATLQRQAFVHGADFVADGGGRANAAYTAVRCYPNPTKAVTVPREAKMGRGRNANTLYRWNNGRFELALQDWPNDRGSAPRLAWYPSGDYEALNEFSSEELTFFANLRANPTETKEVEVED